LFQLFAGAISSIFLLAAAPKFGLGGIWTGLTLFMSCWDLEVVMDDAFVLLSAGTPDSFMK
jgi:hypothetical protein